jgi:hypothetical protein
MFRKIAVALVAASVFTAPVLAQSNSLSGGSTTTNPSNEMEKAGKPEKTEKSAESTEKTSKTEKAEKTEKKVTRHHHATRHHRHGSKAAKFGKARTPTAMSGKQLSAKTPNVAKTETRHIKHGKLLPKRAFGKASKHTPSEMTTH